MTLVLKISTCLCSALKRLKVFTLVN